MLCGQLFASCFFLTASCFIKFIIYMVNKCDVCTSIYVYSLHMHIYVVQMYMYTYIYIFLMFRFIYTLNPGAFYCAQINNLLMLQYMAHLILLPVAVKCMIWLISHIQPTYLESLMCTESGFKWWDLWIEANLMFNWLWAV